MSVVKPTSEATRPGIPDMAWVLSAGVAVALLVLVLRSQPHVVPFFGDGDSRFYRLTARSPFGDGQSFAAIHRLSDVPYRYGRIGYPLISWVLGFGKPAWIDWTLIGVYLASIAAIPGLAAVLLSDLDAPAVAGGLTLLAPGLLLNYGHVYADPLLIALLLLACVLEGRDRRTAALVTLAAAILVKEVAIVALIPWVWAALRRRDRRQLARAASPVVPYVLWCVWLRLRVGEFPFFAHTYSRSGALSAPFVGAIRAVAGDTPNIAVILPATLVTAALGLGGAWIARGSRVGALAFVYAALTLCLGKEALFYLLENARVIAITQVFAILCIVVAISGWRRRRNDSESSAANRGLFDANASL
jgi:hypothetical protein